MIVASVPALAVGPPAEVTVPLPVLVQPKESVIVTMYEPAPILLTVAVVAPPLFHK
ncbi:MAG: hypothetical protein K8R85_01620 [Bacteroidetes bacterium]|nr:hypothetical protein [Bacteroidota bacterium]